MSNELVEILDASPHSWELSKIKTDNPREPAYECRVYRDKLPTIKTYSRESLEDVLRKAMLEDAKRAQNERTT